MKEEYNTQVKVLYSDGSFQKGWIEMKTNLCLDKGIIIHLLGIFEPTYTKKHCRDLIKAIDKINKRYLK